MSKKDDQGSEESVLKEAVKKGWKGGTSGAAAMSVQVCTLMWLRTTMNYQYRYGTTTTEALRSLYRQGGIVRFYRGLGPALLQGPISRFGDTAANVGVLAYLDSSHLPVAVKTGCASIAAGLFRIAIMPIDAFKTTMQVEGSPGARQLMTKVSARGPSVLFHGALAAAGATAVGHFPWFFTFNYLQERIPKADQKDLLAKMSRNAVIGFVSSVVSDTVSNSLRVIKTTRQTFPEVVSYPQVVRHVLEKDGILGLFGRGLKTRILANGIQGLMFSVLWKLFMEMQEERKS